MMKRGFILVELLAVVLILVIILSITIPIVTNIIYNVSISSFLADEQMMINTAKLYLGTNEDKLPKNVGQTIEIKLSLLQSEELISDIKNPWDNSDTCDGYILVTKVDSNTYDYTPYLKCENNYKAGDYIADHLDVYWKLDGNAYDYTPNSNKGTIQNVTTTIDRFGTPNKALSFNGPSNFIDTNYDYSMDYNGDTTFSLWVKFSTIDTGGKVKNIFGKNSWEYILSQVDNKIQFTQWDSAGSYALHLTSNTNLQAGKWYNIVLVYNGLEKKMYLYVNGVIDVSGTTLKTSFVNKSESIKIGRGYPDIGAAASTFFIGIIDNFYVYNRAWSAYEIKLNYDIDKLVSQ